MKLTLDDHIDTLMEGRPCSEPTHDALVVLVLDWQFLGHDRYDLLDAIETVLRTGESELPPDFAERVEQATSYTKPDGRAFYDSSYDAV